MEESAGGAGLENSEGACDLVDPGLELSTAPNRAPVALLGADWFNAEPNRFDVGTALGVEVSSADLLPNNVFVCPLPPNIFDVAGFDADVSDAELACLKRFEEAAFEPTAGCVVPVELPRLPKSPPFCSWGLFRPLKSAPEAGGGPAGVVDALPKPKEGLAGVEVSTCVDDDEVKLKLGCPLVLGVGKRPLIPEADEAGWLEEVPKLNPVDAGLLVPPNTLPLAAPDPPPNKFEPEEVFPPPPKRLDVGAALVFPKRLGWLEAGALLVEPKGPPP